MKIQVKDLKNEIKKGEKKEQDEELGKYYLSQE
jgi:hypothetical protein